MDMNINETWNDQLILQFNDGSTLLGNGGRNGNNAALVYENIGIYESIPGVDCSAFQQQTHTTCAPLIHIQFILYERKWLVNQYQGKAEIGKIGPVSPPARGPLHDKPAVGGDDLAGDEPGFLAC